MLLKDLPKPQEDTSLEVTQCAEEGEDVVVRKEQDEEEIIAPTCSSVISTGENRIENERDPEEDDVAPPSHDEEEEYIDNMTLDCEEALEVWAGFYGADLYGTRMSAEQVARLNDYCTDETFYNPNSCSNGASCRTP